MGLAVENVTLRCGSCEAREERGVRSQHANYGLIRTSRLLTRLIDHQICNITLGETRAFSFFFSLFFFRPAQMFRGVTNEEMFPSPLLAKGTTGTRLSEARQCEKSLIKFIDISVKMTSVFQ